MFADDHALLIDDPEAENRFVLLGLSAKIRVLVVVHCDRKVDAAIRIISARKATKPEQRRYNARWRR